jgi:pimeloyl-ACP methyl ester carboxylesterase
LPEVEIYERLIDGLEKRGGYREAKWNTATKKDATDTFYVFPYDWRLDNVENARLLIRRVETLKRRLGKPGLKFNIIAHSMGGLIARYAAMYGNSDIPAGTPKPTWAGARNFDKIFLLGTPNEGSVLSINALLNGFSYIGGGLNLPFIQDISKFDAFTIPSLYQLLPHEGSFTAYGEDLKPLKIDIYDPAVWDQYGWSIWSDEGFQKKMSAADQRNARPYFKAVLSRAKRFQAALAANGGGKVPVSFFLMGANCKETQSGLLLLRDEKKNLWKTILKPGSFTRANGEKVTEQEVKTLLVVMGDGVVTKSSLAGESWLPDIRKMILPVSSELYQCENHNRLVTNPEIQDKLFALLSAQTVKEVAVP